MATHVSAEKRHRRSERRHERNKRWRSTVRNAVRRARAAAEQRSGDLAERVREAEKVLRRASSKGILHTRTVSRTVSRLHRLVDRVS